MRLLHAGVDTSVIALWLGHEQADTLQIYLHADLELKETATRQDHPARTPRRAATSPPTSSSPSSRPSDYADLSAARKAATSSSRRLVGIIPRSA